MGRMFWKFFLCFWLAQMLTGLGVGVAIWLYHQEGDEERLVDSSPPATMMVSAAAATLEYGGVGALRQWLAQAEQRQQERGRKSPFRVLAVNAAGEELQGRTVSPELLADARRRLQQGDRGVLGHDTADGQHYLLFVQHRHGGGPEEVLRPLTGDLRGELRPGGPPPRAEGARGPAPEAGERSDRDQREARSKPDGNDGPRHDRRRFDLGHQPPVLPLLGGAIASLLSAWLLAWYFAKPIRSLRSAFGAAAEGNLALRVGPGLGRRKDELASLGADFDHMATRLQTLVDSQRRLLHDVSHELRSPLARLQAAIGLLRQQPERTPEFVERIERESQRMDKLVGELLTLARLDAGMAGKMDEEIELDELLADLLGDASFEAETKGCTVSYDEASASTEPLLLRGNAELLHRALDNILRNAIRHSPGGSDIRLHCERQEQQLLLRICDRGPGVPPADLERIFDPFVRSDSSQSSQGYGLGLAIARRVATAHGGRISAHNRDGGGLEMRIELPLAGD